MSCRTMACGLSCMCAIALAAGTPGCSDPNKPPEEITKYIAEVLPVLRHDYECRKVSMEPRRDADGWGVVLSGVVRIVSDGGATEDEEALRDARTLMRIVFATMLKPPAGIRIVDEMEYRVVYTLSADGWRFILSPSAGVHSPRSPVGVTFDVFYLAQPSEVPDMNKKLELDCEVSLARASDGKVLRHVKRLVVLTKDDEKGWWGDDDEDERGWTGGIESIFRGNLDGAGREGLPVGEYRMKVRATMGRITFDHEAVKISIQTPE